MNHRKVTFVNHFGNTLAADLYEPKEYTGKIPAIAVSGPFGAVKEQSSGLYAQEMAERGFLAIAFDPSFTGESGGYPRYFNSLRITRLRLISFPPRTMLIQNRLVLSVSVAGAVWHFRQQRWIPELKPRLP